MLTTMIFISGAVLLCLIFILYHNYLLRQRLIQARLEADRSTRQNLKMQTQYFKLHAEKEWLLQEVHHRVKNHLQLVISLLNMQRGYIRNESALDAFGDIGSRIHAISLIHERLYREESNLTTIDMREYITELVGSIESGDFVAGSVGYMLDLDPIDLDVSQSTPVGLILNEALTNALKHAFPLEPRTFPQIHILLREKPENTILLSVADNGVGLPSGFDWATNASMGLQLIKTLSDQLDGELQMENQPGLMLTLKFARQQQHTPVV
ncbi:MAG: sensor histidine kinase [Bacteroidetes bacterium]|nr:sensor histidine kinase [Bacteroidota bacterium]